MATTRISDNQIADTTAAVVTTLSFLNTTSVLKIPVGDENNRPGSPAVGMIRFNTTNDAAEIYVADADGDGNAGWIGLGSGGGSGAANVLGDYNQIRGNPKTIAEDIVVPAPGTDPTYENAFSVGPSITIANSYSVTIPDTVTWTIFD
tara:strand:- start:690 stop:1133 length:444 start_codon:yes stop_codon:yes gene_type:complete